VVAGAIDQPAPKTPAEAVLVEIALEDLAECLSGFLWDIGEVARDGGAGGHLVALPEGG